MVWKGVEGRRKWFSDSHGVFSSFDVVLDGVGEDSLLWFGIGYVRKWNGVNLLTFVPQKYMSMIFLY